MDNNENPQQQLLTKLKDANYVLVTVGRDPSVDQLAALIGLTLLLNKAGKHAAAVFSGQVPSTLEFLKPEDTIEKTTDSLRDFIIALDKSKADKLRYKVEDDVVRIFITPYKTSITKDDLDFSQGDFNVDVVIALGVTRQEDLDEAIIAHGRILHDATVATVNISAEGDLGSIHWQNPKASSLSEMVTELGGQLGADLIDNQIATAFLTGIVAETERFSNEKTSAAVMSASAALMAAGANQQLVASQLAAPEAPPKQGESSDESNDNQPDDNHPDQSNDGERAETEAEEPAEPPKKDDGEIAIDHAEKTDEPVPTEAEVVQPAFEHESGGSKLIIEPPTLGGQLTANSEPEALEPSSDPMSAPATNGQDAMLTRSTPMASTKPLVLPADEPEPQFVPAPILTATPPQPMAGLAPLDTAGTQTLSELESAVHATPDSLDAARDEVMKALNSDTDQPLEPVQALNAQPMADSLHAPEPVVMPEMPDLQQPIPSLPIPSVSTPMPDPAALAFDPSAFGISSEPGASIPGTPAAPPVPPPIPFNFGTPPTPPTQ